MRKDKDWLSEQVGDLNSTDAVFYESGVSYIDTAVSIERVFELIDQLDELEVLSQEWIEIPKFVAEWIEEQKEVESNLWHVMNNVSIQRNDNPQLWTWIWRGDNMDKFAKAWLDGYTVESEQKYYVLDTEDIPMLVITRGVVNRAYTQLSIHDKGRYTEHYQLTEQEIKDYDERFWAFAVPVEGVEE